MFLNISNKLDSEGKYRKADQIDNLFIRIAQIDLNNLRYLKDTNPHALFNSNPQDDLETVGKKYRLKAKEYHPDINKDPDAEEAFKILQEAIDKIKNNSTALPSENINVGSHLTSKQMEDFYYNSQGQPFILYHIQSCPECKTKYLNISKLIEESERYDNFKHFTDEELEEIKDYPERFFREIKSPEIREMLIKHLEKCYLCRFRLGSGNFVNRLLELLTGEKP